MLPRIERWLADAIEARRPLWVATDFDGTLAPIVHDPSCAAAITSAFAALSSLSDVADVRVAIVTGRALDDAVEKLRDLRGAWICAEHGAEILDPTGAPWRTVPIEHADAIPSFVDEARRLAAATEGAYVEVKRGSVTLHVRRVVDVARRAPLVEAFRRLATARGAALLEGRMMIEALFRRGNKGTAIEALLGEARATTAVVYAGDDVTDEHALEVVHALPFGLAVYVASHERPTPAVAVDAIVESPAEWVSMLQTIAARLTARRR